LQKKTAGPVDVRICTRRDCDTRAVGSWCELGGFSVVGAARQWGTAAVAVGDDWQVVWGPTSDIRPTDSLPDALRKDDLVAVFDYSSQPYRLPLRLAERKTRIGVEPEYVMSVERDRVRLDGKLVYSIRGARATSLELSMPGWELDDVGPDASIAVAGVSRGSRGVTLPLTRPTVGTVEVRIRAHLPLAAGTKSFSAALPRPRADSQRPAMLAVVAADEVELTPLTDRIAGLARRRDVPPMKLAAVQQPPLYYRGTGEEAVFAAEIHPRKPDPEPANMQRENNNVVLIERAWIQTWLTAVGRQDRAVFQLVGRRDSLEVRLPAGAPAYRATVQVDGAPVEPRVIGEDRLSIPLSGQEQSRRTLELRYSFPGARPPRGRMILQGPSFSPDAWVQRAYWQLVLPADEHLLAASGAWSDENVWSWRGCCWRRVPPMDQADLEKWSGAAARAVLAEQANCYLFSSFGSLEPLEPRTTGRTWLVLWASGMTLLVGLVLIHVPVCRGPTALLVAAVALIVAGAVAPGAMLLLAQAGCLGIMLALLTGALQLGTARRGVIARRPMSGAASASRLLKTPTPPSTTSHPAQTPTTTENAVP
jgi:hypothetical protein